jgi:predicted dehydrogenase
MARNPVMERIGRRIRLGVIGGGGEALIGPVHRIAARLDDRFEVVAGILSSDAGKSRASAAAIGIPRAYPDIEAMIAGETARPDGIDAVAIMTPNDTHADLAERALSAGWDVLCEKPLANDSGSGRRLAASVRRSGRVFCLAHNYSGYPMVREARAAVAAGEIGRVHLVQVTYLQGSLAARVEDHPERMPARLKWRLDPTKGGPSHVLGDIGTHAHQLATYVLGSPVEAVLADVGAAVPGRSAHDTASVILRMRGGARGMLLASKAASGAENRILIEAYGEGGGLRWEQANPAQLFVMRPNAPAEVRSAGLPTLHPLARRAVRLPPGHPEGFLEAFANLYRDFAELVAARIGGAEPDPLAAHIPTVADGVAGLAFIDACLASSESGTWAACRDD